MWVMGGRRHRSSVDAVGITDVRQRFQNQPVGLLLFGGTGGGFAVGILRIQGIAQALAGGLE